MSPSSHRAANGAEAELRPVASSDSSAAKVLLVLGAFRADEPSVGVTELGLRTGLPKSTAHRMLGVLLDAGYVTRDRDRYRLALRAFEVGARVHFGAPTNLREVARCHLDLLLGATNETIHLAVLDGSDVVYLDKRDGQRQRPLPTTVGGRVPAHATGVGKALLAFAEPELVTAVVTEVVRCKIRPRLAPAQLRRELEDARRLGYATDFEGVFPGLSCVAAPVLVQGRPIAAVSISIRCPAKLPDSYARYVVATAKKIAAEVDAAIRLIDK
ncbi:IclR family transcriptional regulator [Streptomyces sp. NPDC002928]|uniref:IclR family transcriptional regulator n=1 Tax=Streptomyces sp. NPDC002928 TaxID=3154440 RepID=UPI0033A89867